MAQDTALLLRGLGAAFANRVPQLRQELSQEQEAQYLQQQREDQARKQQYERQEAINSAFAQDVMQGQQLLKQGNFQALFDLSRSTAQSAELLGLPTRPPAEIAMLASKAMAGDSQAITQLEQKLGSYSQQYQRYMPEAEAPKALTASNVVETAEGPMFAMQQPDGTVKMVPAGFAAAPKPEEATRERESRIKEYMDNYGLTRAEAIERLDAQYMIGPTGVLTAINRTTGKASFPSIQAGEPPSRIPPPPSVTEEQLAFDPGKGTGLAAAFLGLWNSTVGQAPLMPTFMGAEQAAQQLTILERDAIRAYASSSRPAVVEQERILKALPKAMDWSENPDIARSKLLSFIDLATTQYVDDIRYARDPLMPKDARESSAERARGVEALISRVLTPEASRAMFDSIRSFEQGIEAVRRLTPEQLQNVDPSTLDDAALDAYIERLKNEGMNNGR